MLTREQNEKLVRVGPGTPAGELLRRYWLPIAASSELINKPVKPIRLLGESLILFRDRQGRLGLIADRCAHRLVNLMWGYPVEEGLRCPYHGWTYDPTGECVAQPAEPAESTFKDKVRLKAYPVQELGGLVFAYLGPEPAPLLPRWEPLVREDLVRKVYFTEVPCNWLQEMENSPDQTHIEWLHGHFAVQMLESRGYPKDSPEYRYTLPFLQRHVDHATEPWDYGLMRRRLREGRSKEDEPWSVGQPVIMPNINLISNDGSMTMIWRTPLDDTHCVQWDLDCTPAASNQDLAGQEAVPCYEIPMRKENGEWNLEAVRVQDHLACMAQGDIMDRTQERLGESDKGIILYRRLLLEQIETVEAGGEPMNVFRDAAQNVCIELPVIKGGFRESTAAPAPGRDRDRPISGVIRVS
jgi:5,5'-dehydrodivanillate O-demethylase